VVPGDAKALARLNRAESDIYIATQNRDSLMVFVNNAKAVQKRKMFKPLPTDSWAELVHETGQIEKIEFYYGAGYLTQSSRTIRISDSIEKLIVHGFDGKSRVVDLASLTEPQ